MSVTQIGRGMIGLFCSGLVLWQFYMVEKKDKRRYQSVISPLYLLLYLQLFIPTLLITFGRELILPELSCILFAIFTQAMVYYTVLLVLLPFLRRWLSPEAVSTLWLLPNYLYLISQPSMRRSSPRAMWLVKPELLRWAAGIWAAGACLVLLYFVVQHLTYKRQLLKSTKPVTDPEVLEQWKTLQKEITYFKKPRLKLVTSPNVGSPLSIGLTQYTIWVVLPEKAYTDQERELIFRHELVHIARGDGALKLTMAVCTALCWFNPLLWLAMKRCAQDTELSCDQLVLEQCGQEQSRQYAELVLSSVGDERGFTTCLSADGEALRYRLQGIVHPKKQLRGGVFVAVILFLLLFTSGAFGMAWRSGTAQELLFQQQSADFALDYYLYWADKSSDSYVVQTYTCLDEAALTRYLGNLELYQMGRLYEFMDEDSLYLVYRRPDGQAFSLDLGEQFLTVRYFGSYETPKSRSFRRVSYYLAQPTDWEQVLRWVEPKQYEESAEEAPA